MRTWIFAFYILLTLQASAQTFEQLTGSALKASKQGKYAEAISLFNKALLIDTGNHIIYDQLAYNHYQLNHLDSTILYSSLSLKKYPADTAALLFRAHSYMDMEKYKEAIPDFEKVLKLTMRRNADISYNIGRCYALLHEYDKAIEYFESVIALEPQNKEVLFQLGYCHANKAQPDKNKALLYYNQAITMDSGYYNAYFNRGLLYFMQFQMNSMARMDMEKCVQLKPDSRAAWYYSGVMYLNDGMYEEARNVFDKVISDHPDYAEAYYERAITWYRTKALDKACTDLRVAESLGYIKAAETKLKYCK